MNYQEKKAVLIKKKEEEAEKEKQEYLKKLSMLANKSAKLNDALEAVERNPRTKPEYSAELKAAWREAKARSKEFLVRSVGISYQRGDPNIFTEPNCNLSLFSERNHWLWLPLWLEESDLEDAVNKLEELPGAVSQRERESRKADLLKQMGEVEREMEQLGN